MAKNTMNKIWKNKNKRNKENHNGSYLVYLQN
jgi:hypothetical protein